MKLDRVEKIEDMAQEFSDRFGALPIEVENLLYAVKIKILAAKAGIESITTEEGQIVIRLFEGMQFDRQKLEPVLGEGITVSKGQIRMKYKRVEGWKDELEKVLKNIT